MGLYPSVRDLLQQPLGKLVGGEKSPASMLLGGLASGSVAYFVGAPLWLVKTRLQAAVQMVAKGADYDVAFGGIYSKSAVAYWQGCGPLVLRGALLTSGQMLGYDGTKTTAKDFGLGDNTVLHVAAATVGGFCAATLSAPADTLLTQFQSAAQRGKVYGSVLECAASMLRETGPGAFFKGWTANFVRLAPTFACGSVIYEQVRLSLGLGYMT